MATYLLDANCFIEAQLRYYASDFCPGFWEWLDKQNSLGVVFSIDKIREELIVKSDKVAEWAKQRNKSFFLPTDEAAVEKLKDVNIWAANSGNKTQLVQKFQGSNDQYLVAFGLAHGHTIVSHENLDSHQKNAIKIPKVCNGLTGCCALREKRSL